MIPYKLVLLAWVPISALFLLDRNAVRGFCLAVIVGMMVLPARKGIEIVGLPDLDKTNVTALGLFLGTMMFHPDRILQFKPRATDLILLLILALGVATSVTNGFGVYDGISVARSQAFTLVLPIFLARIYLTTPRALLMFLTALVIGAIIYVPFTLWEWRMSPQLHTQLYGYFQHSFQQHRRGGFYRPAVCFPQGLALGRFYAFVAFAALFPLRPYLKQRFAFGGFFFLAPLLGLLLSMSWGPYIMFGTLCTVYQIARWRAFVVYLIPLAAALWLVLVFAGQKPLYGSVNTIAKYNAARAQSFQYRLDALEEYRRAIVQRPFLGYGGWGNARTERATDSAFLITSLARGFAGSFLLYGWWFWAMHCALRLYRRFRSMSFGPVCLGIAMLIAMSIAICAIDDALDYYIMFLAGSVLVLDCVLRGMPVPLPAGGRPMPRPVRTGPVYVYE